MNGSKMIAKSTAAPTRLKYAAYTRKSSEGEERQALSIATQQDKAKEFFPHLDVEFLQEEKSAFKPYNRPVFEDMIRRIKAGELHGIIAWHPDRLSRNEIDASTLTYMLRTGELKDLKFCSYNFDNSPEGIWMLQMALSQSQYDSAKKGRDVKRGLEKKVQMGCPPGVAPSGYANNRYRDKGEKDWVKDPERYELVRKMWDMLLSGVYSPPKILEIANNEWGYRTPQRRKLGGVPLSHSTIYKIFTNIKYAGYFYHGQDGILHKGSYDAMITLEEFDRVQAILGKRGRPRPKKRTFAYVGIPTCGECGAAITAELKTKIIKTNGLPKEFTYYRCTHRKKYVKCTQKGCVTEAEIERQIEEYLSKMTILPEFAEWAVQSLEAGLEVEKKAGNQIKEARLRELERVKEDLDNLNRAMYRLQISEEFFKKEKPELEKKIAYLESEINGERDGGVNKISQTKEKFEFAVHAQHHFKNGSLADKRSVMYNLGSNWQLKDRILTFEPDPVYAVIEKAYSPMEADLSGLELAKKEGRIGSEEAYNKQKEAIRLRWLRIVEDVRTGILRHSHTNCLV